MLFSRDQRLLSPLKMSTKLRKIESAFLATTNWNIQDMESGIRQHSQAAKIMFLPQETVAEEVSSNNIMKIEAQKNEKIAFGQKL